ncbi:hypothetical protein BW737_005825 [Actinomyces ruminis]|uniref:Zinc-finger of transposase IS204/IS1001/IS1096/IS1165 n=1 Tax=Actinomyces ruminis TaxID=1937003 RepID=A0ABX4MC52_9ACTO|nr:hypothetical protein BW737_005825 [Actinomyces ruminis]
MGLTATGVCLEQERALVECRLEASEEDAFCGAEGASVGTAARRLAHVPVGWRPTHLLVRLRRWRCQGCERVRVAGCLSTRRQAGCVDSGGRGLGPAGCGGGLHVHLARSSSSGGVVGHRQRRGPGAR